MLMQPPMHGGTAPARGFPKRTFKSLAGLTIALGLALIVICVAEIIYSVKIAPKCEEAMLMEQFEEMGLDDDRITFERKKRSHRDGMPHFPAPPRGGDRPGRPGHRDHDELSEDWVRDARHDSDSGSRDSDSAEDMDWLADAMERHDPVDRCIAFSCAAGLVAFLNVACGVVFVVTGSLGVGAARTSVNHRQSGLKTGYMVMNILVLLGFAPTVFLLGSFIAKAAPVVIEFEGYYTGHVVTGHLAALIGATLGVLCLVAASVTCCCAPTHDQVKVVTMAAAPLPPQEKKVPLGDGVGGVLSASQVSLRVDEKAQLVDHEASQA